MHLGPIHSQQRRRADFLRRAASLALVLVVASAGFAVGSSTSGQLVGLPDVDFSVLAASGKNLLMGGNATASVQIDTNNNVILNNTGSALATNATNGFSYPPSCAGVPSGVPASLPTGAPPCVVDTTDGRIYAYYGGGWNNITGTATTGTLQQTLNNGTTTGGHNITMSSGDSIVTAAGINMILAPATTGNTIIRGSTNTGQAPGTTLTVDGTVSKINSGQGNIVSIDTQAMAAGVGGGIFFEGQNNTVGPAYTTFAGIQGTKENSSNNNNAGTIQFFSRTTAGSLPEAGRFSSTQAFYANSTAQIGASAGAPLTVANGTALQVDGAPVVANSLRAILTIADTTTGTAQGIGGGVTFLLKYDGSNWTNVAYVQPYKENGTSGNYASSLVFGARANGGNLNNTLALDSTGRVRVTTAGAFGFTSSATDAVATALDGAITRIGAASLAIGNGGATDGSGTLTLTNLTSPSATTLALQRAGTPLQTLVGVPTASAATSVITYPGVNGSSVTRGVLHTSTTLNTGATSTNLGVQVPASAIVYAVTTRVTTTITTAVNYSVQDASGNPYINATTNVTATNTTSGGPGAAGTFFYNFYPSANTFKIVTNVNPGAGVVETEIYYYLITAPTS